MVRHENTTSRQPRLFGIANHTGYSAHDSRTTSQTFAFFAPGCNWSTRIVRTISLRVIYRPASLETISGNRSGSVLPEFFFSQRGERSKIRGRRRAVTECENFSEFNIKNVACIIKTPDGLQPPPCLQKQAAYHPKQ